MRNPTSRPAQIYSEKFVLLKVEFHDTCEIPGQISTSTSRGAIFFDFPERVFEQYLVRFGEIRSVWDSENRERSSIL